MKHRGKIIYSKKRNDGWVFRLTAAEHIAEWLNFAPNDELLRILQYAQQLDVLQRDSKNYLEAEQLCKEFCCVLREYQMFYYLRILNGDAPELSFGYSQFLVHCDDSEDGFRPPLNAISTILEMLERGTINHIKKCEQCGKWIAARDEGNKFCSKKCQQRQFESRPDIKERKKAQRLRNYHRKRDEEKQGKKELEVALGTTFRSKTGLNKVRKSA